MESTLKLKPSSSNKYPANTSPNDSWTIEQLLFWSLDQYHSAAISKTNSHLGALRLQCENECDDVIMLHELAVKMKDDNQDHVDPQHNHDLQQLKLKQPPAATTNTAKAALIITIISGPHASQTYKLQPKHTQPCLIGRSKGKKFLRNGISLSKDQEVSTTHGKFSVEELVLELDESDDDAGNNIMGHDSQAQVQAQVQKKFYYTDVGSTNGSTVGEARLEANVRVEIEEGMELRIGNSTLKIAFG